MKRALLALAVVLAGSSIAGAQTSATLKPLLAAHDWLGAVPSGTELRGKVVLVDVFTFGCYNCQNVVPNLKALHVVEHRLAEILAILPIGDDLTRMAFGGVEHCLDRRQQRVGAELLDVEVVDPAPHFLVDGEADPNGSMVDLRMCREVCDRAHDLGDAGLVVSTDWGEWRITDRGREALATSTVKPLGHRARRGALVVASMLVCAVVVAAALSFGNAAHRPTGASPYRQVGGLVTGHRHAARHGTYAVVTSGRRLERGVVSRGEARLRAEASSLPKSHRPILEAQRRQGIGVGSVGATEAGVRLALNSLSGTTGGRYLRYGCAVRTKSAPSSAAPRAHPHRRAGTHNGANRNACAQAAR